MIGGGEEERHRVPSLLYYWLTYTMDSGQQVVIAPVLKAITKVYHEGAGMVRGWDPVPMLILHLQTTYRVTTSSLSYHIYE